MGGVSGLAPIVKQNGVAHSAERLLCAARKPLLFKGNPSITRPVGAPLHPVWLLQNAISNRRAKLVLPSRQACQRSRRADPPGHLSAGGLGGPRFAP
jgi:hypothetical protein